MHDQVCRLCRVHAIDDYKQRLRNLICFRVGAERRTHSAYANTLRSFPTNVPCRKNEIEKKMRGSLKCHKLKNGTAAALWIASGCCCCCDCHLLLKSCAGLIFAFRLPLFMLFLLPQAGYGGAMDPLLGNCILKTVKYVTPN